MYYYTLIHVRGTEPVPAVGFLFNIMCCCIVSSIIVVVRAECGRQPRVVLAPVAASTRAYPRDYHSQNEVIYKCFTEYKY